MEKDRTSLAGVAHRKFGPDCLVADGYGFSASTVERPVRRRNLLQPVTYQRERRQRMRSTPLVSPHRSRTGVVVRRIEVPDKQQPPNARRRVAVRFGFRAMTGSWPEDQWGSWRRWAKAVVRRWASDGSPSWAQRCVQSRTALAISVASSSGSALVSRRAESASTSTFSKAA